MELEPEDVSIRYVSPFCYVQSTVKLRIEDFSEYSSKGPS